MSKRPEPPDSSGGRFPAKQCVRWAPGPRDQGGQVISRAKALGIPDKDIGTSGYSANPNYIGPCSIDGYVASEQLQLKWHNVDTVGKTLDALVQEGGATQV